MYSSLIQGFIELCQWDTSRLFVISKNVFDPFIYYSHLLPLILSLGLGIFILIKGGRLLVNKVLGFITFTFAGWAFFDLILWASDRPEIIMSFWSFLIILEVLIYAATLYFVQIFITGNDTTLRSKIIIALLILPIIFLLPTSLSLSGFDLTNCEREAREGFLAQYGYAIQIVFVLWAVIFALHRWQRTKDNKTRSKIVLVTVGALLFLLTFSWGNIVGSFSDDWKLPQWGLFGMPIFIAFLGYLIVKFRAFNVKIFATQALVWSLWIMIGAILFVAQSDATRIIVVITEIIALVFGFMLINSVKREIEQRERLEKLTKELESANDQLRILDKQKNEFLSFASHDLKSPIALIKQFATLIYDGTYKEPAKVHETVLKIKNTADRAVNMVNTFLDLRKIEEGRMEYNFEKKNIVEFVGGITSDFTLLAKQQKNIDVSFASSRPSIETTIDTNTLRQVIQNFLDNSLKYTESGWIKVEVIDEQKTLLLKFSDSGLGMDKELLPILFEQFHRDPGVAKKIQGTGLGLYISKQIILAHHGDTWAESDGKGKGSQFYIRLPKA